MDIRANAKINLSLDICGILDNGYHSVSMLMQSVELCDIVSIEKSDDISVQTDNPLIPDGKENIAYRACELMINEYKIPHGFSIKIKKNIPVAGGMAGGSTDAAAVMRGINEICNLDLSNEKLMELALFLGADVPFCIQKKPALAEGVGEKLTPIKGLSKDLYILLINPNILISTKEIYGKIDYKKCFNIVNNEALISALNEKKLEKAAPHMINVMQSVTEEICPEIGAIINRLYENGADVALMSGSGATCYGIFKSIETAQKAQKSFGEYFTAITNPVE